MYNIAIVTNDKFEGESLANKIKDVYRMTSEIKMFIFRKVEELLGCDQHLDIILLDTDMEGVGDLKIVESVRLSNKRVSVILFGQLTQSAILGYEVQAKGFLLKPIDDSKLRFFLDKEAVEQKKRKISKLVVKTELGNTILPLQKILYMQVQGHHVFIYCENGKELQSIKMRGRLKDFENNLRDCKFARCSVYSLVNLNHILSIKNNVVKLKEKDICIPIGRSYKKAFMEQVSNFSKKSQQK